jgi:hypothetical protein
MAKIGFRGAAPSRVDLSPREDFTVPAEASMTVRSRRRVRDVQVDLMVQIDEVSHARAPGEVDVRFHLPAGVPALLGSRPPLDQVADIGGRAVYRLKRSNELVGEVELVYSTHPVALDVGKSLEPMNVAAAGPVRVTLAITNLSKAEATNVVLEDSFDATAFSGSGPDFRRVGGGVGEVRLVWSRTVDRIPAGGKHAETFVVQAKRPLSRIVLSAATARIGDDLVGFSDRLKLP